MRIWAKAAVCPLVNFLQEPMLMRDRNLHARLRGQETPDAQGQVRIRNHRAPSTSLNMGGHMLRSTWRCGWMPSKLHMSSFQTNFIGHQRQDAIYLYKCIVSSEDNLSLFC